MKRMDLPIGKIERGQNGMEVYNSKEQAEDIEYLKIAVKNLEKTVEEQNERINSMEKNCDEFYKNIEELESLIEELEPHISEVEYPKER
jgi:peptidoglycan hydrolase CwlO-like protein